MADQEKLLEQLRAAGKDLEAADAARERAMASATAAVNAAVVGGISIAEVSRVVGLSRPTIYKMLEGPI